MTEPLCGRDVAEVLRGIKAQLTELEARLEAGLSGPDPGGAAIDDSDDTLARDILDGVPHDGWIRVQDLFGPIRRRTQAKYAVLRGLVDQDALVLRRGWVCRRAWHDEDPAW